MMCYIVTMGRQIATMFSVRNSVSNGMERMEYTDGDLRNIYG